MNDLLEFFLRLVAMEPHIAVLLLLMVCLLALAVTLLVLGL